MKRNRRGLNPASKPSGNGCVECLASPDGWWLHLRRCTECGHIGCCDSSPSQHASRHAAATGHPIIASFEPTEHWFYDYETAGNDPRMWNCFHRTRIPRVSPSRASRKGARELGITPPLAARYRSLRLSRLPFGIPSV